MTVATVAYNTGTTWGGAADSLPRTTVGLWEL